MPSLLESYKRWVIANTDSVRRIEETTRMLTLLLPQSAEGTDLASEAAYSLINLWVLANNSIVNGPSQPHAVLQPVRWALTIASNVAVVAEMAVSKYRGEEQRWRSAVAM